MTRWVLAFCAVLPPLVSCGEPCDEDRPVFEGTRYGVVTEYEWTIDDARLDGATFIWRSDQLTFLHFDDEGNPQVTVYERPR